ncbi:Protein of unknown function [Rhizobiales bacterium GAS191]|nr:Protein of unknown function [Rhizobiales bacterium GAS191]
MLSTYVSYEAIVRNKASSLASTAAQPAVANQTQYYLANIGKVKTIGDFVNNYNLFSFAMKAYGLEDMTYVKGLMTKVLEGGVSDQKSLANTLTDPRYKAFATAFNFLANGAATTSTAAATTSTVSAYVQQTLEDNAGNQNQGVRLALYFERMAPTIKTAYNILADPALLAVVQTTLDIPAASSAQDLALQAQTITGKMNIADLQNPAKLQAFIGRFTAVYDANNSSSSAPANALLVGQEMTGISPSLLESLQGLKLGGS